MKPVINYPGVTLQRVHLADSENYLFLDLHLAPSTQPGQLTIEFQQNGQRVYTHAYSLLSREPGQAAIKGFDATDVVYLITPDRFANGNPENDSFASLQEQGVDREKNFTRHGGDIRGIINHLDYLQDMGFTALWPSPLLDNDMPAWSYHGYAMTDFYHVDPRFGTLAEYRELADEGRARGIKLIMDQVANHCGSSHWWMEDLPFSDWLNYQDDLQVTNHRRTTNQDPYAATADRKLMTGGWFVPTMPDLNQRNPFMAEYIIQNSIWWIETLGLGGIRQDTYPYPDKDFMSRWTCRIMDEYPNFSIVGEEWSYNPLVVAYWQGGKLNADGYQSCLRSPMDFPLQRTLTSALIEEESWDKGLVKLYEGLVNDFVYANPLDLMIFPDNHDMDRIFTQLGEEVPLLHQALVYLSTTRGIPQLYYGTEILMENTGFPGDHGVIRTDFPGGWAGDEVNAVTGEGLSADQKATQQLLRRLLNWRKETPTIHWGKTMHFAPRDNTYTYFRYDDQKVIMVVINKNEEATTLDVTRFAEIATPGMAAINVLTEEKLRLPETLALPAMQAVVLELHR